MGYVWNWERLGYLISKKYHTHTHTHGKGRGGGCRDCMHYDPRRVGGSLWWAPWFQRNPGLFVWPGDHSWWTSGYSFYNKGEKRRLCLSLCFFVHEGWNWYPLLPHWILVALQKRRTNAFLELLRRVFQPAGKKKSICIYGVNWHLFILLRFSLVLPPPEPLLFFFFFERKLMKTMFMCSKAQRKFITLRNSTLHKWNESNLIYDRKGPQLDGRPPHSGCRTPAPTLNGRLEDTKHICSLSLKLLEPHPPTAI